MPFYGSENASDLRVGIARVWTGILGGSACPLALQIEKTTGQRIKIYKKVGNVLQPCRLFDSPCSLR